MSSIQDNPIWQDFMVAEILLRSCFEDGSPPGIVLCGPGGLGKTFLVRKLYREYFSREVANFSGSARGLLDFLYENADGIILIDDFDKAFYTSEIINIFKKLLDSNEPRIISHSVKGPNSLPPFRVSGGAVICSNLDFNDPSLWSRKMWEVYIKPFKSRLSTSIIRLSFKQSDIFDYTLWMAPKILNGLSHYKRASGIQRKLTEPQQKEIITHFRDNFDSYPEITPRIIYNLGKMRLGAGYDDQHWTLLRRKMLSDWATEREREAEAIERWKEEGETSVTDELGSEANTADHS